MFDFVRKSLFGLTAAVALGAGAAEAVTVISENGTYNIGYGDQFIGNVTADGGAGSWQVQFDATEDPLAAIASATIGPIVAGTFTNLVMSWVAVSDGFTLASVNVSAPGASLGTLFASVGVLGGDDISQYLVFTWTNSLAGAGFDVEVAAGVPVPAAGFLLIGALGGLVLVRRRAA
jgi:hypothetical protein